MAHHEYLYHRIGYKNGDIIINSGGIYISKFYRNRNIYWLEYPRHTIWGHICYSALYLTDSTINFYIKNLLNLRPAILRGYPSFWNQIAEFILNNSIKLDFRVKGINLTSEDCLDTQKENIEKAFSSMVYFEYGQTEMSVFYYTDDKSYLYKPSPLYGYLEVIKEDGMDAQEAEEGEMVVTSFCNRGMPFIRYRTGDRVVVAKKKNGLIYFKKILGRTQDYIILKDKQKIFLTALIFGQHFNAFKKISRWQLIQNEVGKVNIKIIRLPDYSQADEDEIKEKFQNVADIELEFDYVDKIPLTKTGKYMFLIQNIGKAGN